MSTVRLLQPQDLDEIESINAASFAVPWSKEVMAEELNNPVTCYLVLEAEGKVAGYAGAWIILDEAHVTNVAVAPAWRGRGYGQQLMAALKRCCAGRGARHMTLEVRRSNAAALRVYAKEGFRQEGVRRGYYGDNGEDALILWSELEREDEDETTS